jgi:hypothetical protein
MQYYKIEIFSLRFSTDLLKAAKFSSDTFILKRNLGTSGIDGAMELFKTNLPNTKKPGPYIFSGYFGNPAVSWRPCRLSAPFSRMVEYYRISDCLYVYSLYALILHPAYESQNLFLCELDFGLINDNHYERRDVHEIELTLG